MKRVRQGLQAVGLGLGLGLTLALSACGGGGTHTTVIVPHVKQWRGVELSDRAMAIVPGGGNALVGDAPELDWLAFQVDTGEVAVQQTVVGGGNVQTAASPRATGVHGMVFSASGRMARAGDWTVLVGRDGAQIWAQMAGPGGLLSARWPLSSTAGAVVHPVIDASGRARIYWSETISGLVVTRAMRFEGINPIDDGVVLAMSMDLLRVVAGPDGKGWLFYARAGGQYVRAVDALAGLGAATRLDETARGPAEPSRLALAENTGRVTTVALQNVGTSTPCVGVRRLDAGNWSTTHCANTDAAQGVGGGFADLAVEAGGRALVVWSGGAGDRTLYGAFRRADGSWTAPRVVVTAPAGAVFVSIQARIHTGGTAIVAYRQADGVSDAAPYAVLFDASAEAWGPAERFDPADGGLSAGLSVAFDTAGQPGILNFAQTPSRGRYLVRFATRQGGQWRAVSLQNDVPLAMAETGATDPDTGEPVLELVSMQRLVPLAQGGWSAFWELSSGLVPGFGHRVVAASYQ